MTEKQIQTLKILSTYGPLTAKKIAMGLWPNSNSWVTKRGNNAAGMTRPVRGIIMNLRNAGFVENDIDMQAINACFGKSYQIYKLTAAGEAEVARLNRTVVAFALDRKLSNRIPVKVR